MSYINQAIKVFISLFFSRWRLLVIRFTNLLPLNFSQGTVRVLPEQSFLPDAYRLPEGSLRGSISEISPRVVFIEVTNRCNLFCETCPRTFFKRETLHSL